MIRIGEEDEEVKIIRTKKRDQTNVSGRCMRTDGALYYNFFVFLFNAETEQVNVVYKRKGNTTDWIEPEF